MSPRNGPVETFGGTNDLRTSFKNGDPDVDELENLALQYAGRLLLRQEIPLDDITFKKLLSRKAFTPQPSMKKIYNRVKCLRCGNQTKHLFAEMPCQICRKNCLYCRKCIEMGRVMACQPLYAWTGIQPDWPTASDCLTWDGQLTTEQQHASNQLLRTLHAKDDMLVWAVCGSGKTEMLFACINEALSHGQRVCIATPRADVVRELLPRLEQAFSATVIQALYGGSVTRMPTAPFIISTTHQLLRFQDAFDLMIIDEIDAFPFHKDPSLPYAAKRAVKRSHTSIYLTATPRKEQQRLIKEKKLPHVFVPKRFHGHPLPVPKCCMCFDLRRALKQFLVPKKMIKWVKNRKNPDRQLLVFVPTIQMAEEVGNRLSQQLEINKMIMTGNNLQFVHAKDPHRKELVKQFRDKKIDILITTTILERGVTFPSVDVAVVDGGHEVFDQAALVQIAGRAGRSPADPDGEVVFFHDGKTKAMSQAIKAIIMMNKKAGF
ncbi:DEAD/DEAH box helicase [Virgibacillus halophilus]|uniref:DEAD/DEAH box helicase n=1 Tax=Tigheibacillus halophilus TaxID=361280 RepID=A0ABU5C1R1_9BACI|nr:DEAD/DEAH box helicase [Virgibacillus halophilus]